MKNITRWSYSRLGTYESCPKKAFYKYIEQLPEKQHPAAERGTRIHQLAEDYIVGSIKEMPKELRLFKEAFEKIKAAAAEGIQSLSNMFGFEVEVSDTMRNKTLKVRI